MRHPIAFSRHIRIAVLLGLGSLALNLLGTVGSPALTGPKLGAVFIFMAAGALGASSAMIVAVVAAAGELLVFPEHAGALRLILLAVGTSLLLRTFPRMQIFSAVGLLWLMALIPYGFINNPGFSSGQQDPVLFTGLWDVLLAVVAGLALINPSVWGLLTAKPRRAELTTVLSHGIAAATMFPLIGAVTIVGVDTLFSVPRAGMWLVTLTSFSLLMALWLSERLSTLIQEQETHLLHGVGQRRFRSISQFASEVWRGRRELWNRASGRSVDELDRTKSRAVLARAEGREVGICALGRNGTIAFMNERFREMAGLQAGETLGRRFEAIPMNRRFMEAARELVDQSFAKGSGGSSEVRLNQFPDRLRFLKLSTEVPSNRSSTDPQNIILTIEDITERRTMDYDVIVDQRKESLNALISGMSHALNNSLTTIAGHASAAQRLSSSAAIEQALSSIVQASRDAGNVVRQLLDFAELRSCSPKPERIEQLLNDNRDLLKRAAGEAFEVQCSFSPCPRPVACDAGLLMQAVTNLVLRAKDAYPDGHGPLWISLEPETFEEDALRLLPGARVGTFARVQVRDEGRGMSPETLRQLLDPSRSHELQHEHVGIRLATAYAIVLAHDGFLIADSHPDRGTTVSLYFPLAPESSDILSKPAPQTQTPPAPSPASDTPRETILVVEDDDNIRSVVSSMLSTMGYRVVTCSNGDEALKKCADQEFDLMLVDLVMPRMHGLEVLERVRGQYPKMRTLLMTGSGQVTQNELGKQPMIPKPFDMEGLATAIRNSLTP